MLILLLGLLACAEKDPEDVEDGGGDGGDAGATEDYGSGCEEVSRTVVKDLAVPADGFAFAPGPLLAVGAGSFEGTAAGVHVSDAWKVVASFRLEDPVYAVDYEPREGDDGEELYWEECFDIYETQVEASFRVGDGLVALDDVAATLTLWEESRGAFSVDLDEDEIDLALLPPDVDLEEWDSWGFDLRAELNPRGWWGTVGFMAEVVDGDVAMAMGTEVLQWDLGGGDGEGEPE